MLTLEEDKLDPATLEMEVDEFDDEDVSIKIGSPIFYDGEVSDTQFKDFKTIFNWSREGILEKFSKSLHDIEPLVFGLWVDSINKDVPLGKKLSHFAAKALSGSMLIDYIISMSNEDKESFRKFRIARMSDPSEEERKTAWDIASIEIAMSLCQALQPLRLGRGSADPHSRSWRGRHCKVDTVYCVTLARNLCLSTIGEEFMKTFLGESVKNIDWVLEERGGLWRINLGGEMNCWYIEEYDPENAD